MASGTTAGVRLLVLLVWALSLCSLRAVHAQPPIPDDVRHLQPAFEAHYAKWKQHCAAQAHSSRLEPYFASTDYAAIVAMGPRVLPLIVRKSVEDPSFPWLSWAWADILGVTPDPAVYPWAGETILAWWQAGPQRTDDRLLALAARWRELRTDDSTVLWSSTTHFDEDQQFTKTLREETELGHTYLQLSALGLAALPRLTELIAGGDADFLWLVRVLTEGRALLVGESLESKAGSYLTWWEANQEDWLIPWPEEEAEE